MTVHQFALTPLWAFYLKRVFPCDSTGVMFNQYRDALEGVDVLDAAELRRKNLVNYLRAYPEVPPVLIVGEAPGPRGCRFTGVPFSSECLYAENLLPFKGHKTSAQVEYFSEPTATIFWRVMARHFPKFLIWNTLPFHPHLPGVPLSIRPPSKKEVREHLSLMEEVLRIIRPERVLAVGRVAQSALQELECSFVPIRHPSHGGSSVFARGMTEVFDYLTVDESQCIPSS